MYSLVNHSMQCCDDEITNGIQSLHNQYEVSGLQATTLVPFNT